MACVSTRPDVEQGEEEEVLKFESSDVLKLVELVLLVVGV